MMSKTEEERLVQLTLNYHQVEYLTWSVAIALASVNRDMSVAKASLKHLEWLSAQSEAKASISELHKKIDLLSATAFPEIPRVTRDEIDMAVALKDLAVALLSDGRLPIPKSLGIGTLLGRDCAVEGHCGCEDETCCYCGKSKSS